MSEHEALQTATLANWRSPPFNRWAFNHVSELIPVDLIKHDMNHAQPLPQSPCDLTGINIPHHGQLSSFASWLEKTHTDSLVILKDGNIVYEYYASGQAADLPHIWMSVSKSITGLIAGILMDRGLLDPSLPVSHILPELETTAYANASIQDLLDMRIPVQFSEDYSSQNPLMRTYRKAQQWLPWESGDKHMHLPEFFTLLTKRSHTGRNFHYVSPNTDICGWLLERMSARPFAELVQKFIWQPLGATSDAYITIDGIGTPRCAGGFCATVRDMAMFARLWTQGGKAHHTQIMPKAWMQDTLSQGSKQAWNNGDFAAGFAEKNMSYRNYWYICADPNPLIFAIGVFGQNLFIYPDDDLVIAKASSQPNADDDAMHCLTHKGIHHIRAALCQ